MGLFLPRASGSLAVVWRQPTCRKCKILRTSNAQVHKICCDSKLSYLIHVTHKVFNRTRNLTYFRLTLMQNSEVHDLHLIIC